MAPELCNEQVYGKGVDVWSTGVICYALLTGAAPFPGRSKQDIYNLIINSEPDMSKLRGASNEAKEFIKACL